MIQVRRRLLFSILAVCLACVLYLAVRGYLTVLRSASSPADLVRTEAETILFLGIVASVLIILLFTAVLLKSINVSRRLDKLISQTRNSSYTIEETLRRLGPLGDKIRQLQAQIQELSERRSLRLSSLSGILEFLLNNTDLPLLVLDLNGGIEGSSRGFLEHNPEKADGLRGRHIGELESDLSFPEVVSRMGREHAPVGQAGKDRLVYYPVYDRTGQLANVIAVQGPAVLELVATAAAESRSRGSSRFIGLIRHFTRRRQKG